MAHTQGDPYKIRHNKRFTLTNDKHYQLAIKNKTPAGLMPRHCSGLTRQYHGVAACAPRNTVPSPRPAAPPTPGTPGASAAFAGVAPGLLHMPMASAGSNAKPSPSNGCPACTPAMPTSTANNAAARSKATKCPSPPHISSPSMAATASPKPGPKPSTASTSAAPTPTRPTATPRMPPRRSASCPPIGCGTLPSNANSSSPTAAC